MSEVEEASAAAAGASLLYGEMLPQGVAKAMDEWHLHAAAASRMVDLGCGTGKLCLQAFLDHPTLLDVFGVEVSRARYGLGERALLRLAATFPDTFSVLTFDSGNTITLGVPVGPPGSMASHPRLDAAALLRWVAGEAPPAGGEDETPPGSAGEPGQDALHPADPQRSGSPGHSPGLGEEEEEGGEADTPAARIHIPPTPVRTSSSGGLGRAPPEADVAAASKAGLEAPPHLPSPTTPPPHTCCSVAYDPAAWRTLRLAWGDMFDTCHVGTADLICLETDVPTSCYPMLAALLRAAAGGARILSYLNLAEVWPFEMRRFFNLEQLVINRSPYDRFWTSWSYVNGHKFFLWQVTRKPQHLQVDVRRQADGTTHVLVTVPSPPPQVGAGGPLITRDGRGFEPPEPLRLPGGGHMSGVPQWTWADVCAVHGAGRRPRLLAFGGLLNHFNGCLRLHQDTPLTFMAGHGLGTCSPAESVSLSDSDSPSRSPVRRPSTPSPATLLPLKTAGSAAVHPSPPSPCLDSSHTHPRPASCEAKWRGEPSLPGTVGRHAGEFAP